MNIDFSANTQTRMEKKISGFVQKFFFLRGDVRIGGGCFLYGLHDHYENDTAKMFPTFLAKTHLYLYFFQNYFYEKTLHL